MSTVDPSVYGFFVFLTTYCTWIVLSNAVSLAATIALMRQEQQKNTPKGMKSVTSQIIFNLTLTDLITGLFHVIGLSSTGGNYDRLGDAGCTVFAFGISTTASQSLLMILLLGYVRYRSLLKEEMDPKFVVRAIIGSWTGAALYGMIAAVAGATSLQPSHLYCFITLGRYNWVTTFMSTATLLVTFAPALLLLACYWKAFRNVRNYEANGISIGHKYSPRVARIGIAVVVTYIVTITPFSVMSFYRLVVDPEQTVSPTIDALVICVTGINFGVNPIIYFKFNSKFRHVVQRWFPFLKGSFLSSMSSSSGRPIKSMEDANTVNSQTNDTCRASLDSSGSGPTKVSIPQTAHPEYITTTAGSSPAESPSPIALV